VLEDDGAFAELLVAAESQLVPVPPELKSTDAATLVDAGATAANAARQVPADDPRPVLVVGAGPLGFFAAQLLRPRHEVIAIEPQSARRSAVRRLGLDAVADLAELDVLAGAVVDCTGAPSVFPIGLELLGAGGTYVVAGYGPVETHLAPVARKELTIRGVRSGRRADLERVLGALAAGELEPPDVTTWPLAEINAAFAALRAGDVPGKAVIDLTAPGGPDE
jgi:2-desacetyl-2-hydroxyethyl bacteriochlorophyllide A dehydrogenase